MLTALLDDTRADWDARPPTRPLTPVALSQRREFFNHYIGPGSPDFAHRPHSDCLAAIRSWQGYHQTVKDWKDIGYGALICGHARAVEGRGLDYEGSHCPGFNVSGFGVQLMVAGTERPTDAMFRRTRQLYDDLCDAKGSPLAKRGHRDGIATECPGDIIYAWVRAGMPAPILPPPSPPAPREAPDMIIVQVRNQRPQYVYTGTHHYWIPGPEAKANLAELWTAAGLSTKIHPVASLDGLGVLVGPDPDDSSGE